MTAEEDYALFWLEDEEADLGEVLTGLLSQEDVWIERVTAAEEDPSGKDCFVVVYEHYERLVDYLQERDIDYYPSYREEI